MRKFIQYSLIGLLLVSFVGCSSTSSIQSAPLSYYESKTDMDERPVLRGQITVLFREKPSKGAIQSFTDNLSSIVESITPAGVVAVFSTSPERAFSSLETGKRGQVTIPFSLDIPKEKNIDLTITTTDIRTAGKKALAGEEVPGQIEGVYVDKIKFELKTKSVK